MKKNIFIFPLLFLSFFSFGQTGPALLLPFASANQGDTVEIDVVVNNSAFNNIVTMRGTIEFDTAIVQFLQISSYGFSTLNSSHFNTGDAINGKVGYNWQSIISIGPSLSLGASFFKMKFYVKGGAGTTSPLNFTSSVYTLYWADGFVGSGTPITSNGWITVLGNPCPDPIPMFQYSRVVDSVSFQNSSTVSGSNVAYFWNFGDGDTSNLENPSHTYFYRGYYPVCLTVNDSCSSQTYCDTLLVCGTSRQSLMATPIGGLQIQFDVMVDTLTSWYYVDFGDGDSDTNNLQPIHTYAPGVYSASLFSYSDSCAADTSVVPINIFSVSEQETLNYVDIKSRKEEIIVSSLTGDPIVNLTLFDLNGREVLVSDFNKQMEKRLFTDEISTGIYLLKIQMGEKTLFKKLFR